MEEMTASEMLRDVCDAPGGLDPRPEQMLAKLGWRLAGSCGHYTFISSDATRGMCDLFGRLADKIDAELAQARELSLLRGAELWAKANGWPDFRDGEDFGAWLDRCAIPRPRYDDGEPVQDADLEEIGSLATCYVYTDGSWVFDPDPYEDERNPKAWCKQCGDRDDRVKCPALEVLLGDGKPVSKGETVYVIESGIERTVKNFGTKLCEGMDGWDGSPWVMFDNGSWMHARDLTHEHPVLGADGLPIKVGDTVWLVDEYSQYAGSNGSANGNEYSLLGVDPQETLFVEYDRLVVSGKNYVRLSTCNAWCHASWLTHTPPDTQERIDEDAEKFHCVYFGGYSACGTCPASTGELSKKSCKQQQIFDLLRRQRELDKRKGGAE